ncbi:putative reverse transcriptase domain-containing protein [Tanacetum coccineum]
MEKENIIIDFVTKLPRTAAEQDTIWVIVDRLTKSAHLLPMREDDTSTKRIRYSIGYEHSLPSRGDRHGQIEVDDKLNFSLKTVEIMDREVKRLKQSRIPIVKVRWNSKRGPEFTWEREDQMQKKYPHLFTNSAPAAEVAS